MSEPTYSQIEAACRAWLGGTEYSDPITETDRITMKRALIAAQAVDPSVYGHMHHGYSCGGVNLQSDSGDSIKKVMHWHHDSEHVVPVLREELIRARAKY